MRRMPALALAVALILQGCKPAADGQVLAGHESARENKEKIERLRKELKQAEAEGRQLAASTKGQLLD